MLDFCRGWASRAVARRGCGGCDTPSLIGRPSVKSRRRREKIGRKGGKKEERGKGKEEGKREKKKGKRERERKRKKGGKEKKKKKGKK